MMRGAQPRHIIFFFWYNSPTWA